MLMSTCSDKELEEIEQTLYENNPEEVDEIICYIETMPKFKGGTEALMKYIKENHQHQAGKVQEGIVFVSFIVTETGKVTEVKVYKGLNENCDKEAIRLVENMPDWEPAEQPGRGIKIRSRMMLPIRFQK
jgi:protein TonB